MFEAVVCFYILTKAIPLAKTAPHLGRHFQQSAEMPEMRMVVSVEQSVQWGWTGWTARARALALESLDRPHFSEIQISFVSKRAN